MTDLAPISGSRKANKSGFLICSLIIVVFLIVAGSFAATQSVWVDESTQLSGQTLNPIEQVRWLAGFDDHDFGVPPDRMPPLSYWLGWIWHQIFGFSEISLRWFGIGSVAIGIPAVWLATRGIASQTSAFLATTLFALTPNVLTAAPEIRAYPLFIATSCWGCYAFIRFVTIPAQTSDNPQHAHSRKWWGALLALFCLLSAYTHYYGIIMSGSLWMGAGLIRIYKRENFKPELIGGLITAIGLIGVLPFVLASLPDQGAAPTMVLTMDEKLRNVIRFFYRLVAHPAAAVYLPLLGALLLGVALLGMNSLKAALSGLIDKEPVRTNESTKNRAIFCIIFSMIIGIVVPLAASFVVSSFEALDPHYNDWLLPFVYVLLGAGLASAYSGKLTQAITACAALLALLGTAAGAYSVVAHRTVFSHGPGNWATQIVRESVQASTQPAAVIFSKTGEWGHTYFPMYYHFRETPIAEQVQYYMVDQSGVMYRVNVGASPQELADQSTVPWQYMTQVWVSAHSMGSSELGRVARGDIGKLNDRPKKLPEFWPNGEPQIFNAFFGAKIWVVDK